MDRLFFSFHDPPLSGKFSIYPPGQAIAFRRLIYISLEAAFQYRRLSKDYELLPETSESMIYTVMIRLMLKRLGQFQVIA
ncbi:MAG TPA: hypothetical protein VIQ31_13115 [Phormidium sp.]